MMRLCKPLYVYIYIHVKLLPMYTNVLYVNNWDRVQLQVAMTESQKSEWEKNSAKLRKKETAL